MITRTRVRFVTALAVLLSAASACQRVPLLAPSGSTITLTTSTTTLPTNGRVAVEAQVLEPAGTPPHSGTHITFTTTLGTIEPSETETDINGRATATFNSGTSSGTATITASSGGATTGAAGAIKIAVGAAAVGRITLSANPGTVAGSGGSSTIVASILDTNGNTLPGVPVTFTTTAGSFSASVITTDSSGTAQTVLTTSRTATVTATAGVSSSTGTGTGTGTGAGGTTSAPQSATVTVNVNASSTITVGAASPSAPVVGQAVTFPITYTQNANGSPVARVLADFGDGTPAQTITGQPSAVTHAYTQIGTFTVRVTAIDTFGDVANGSGSVTIAPRPQLVVGISVSANPTAGTPTTFTITATPTSGSAITSVTVDLGDGTRRTLAGAVGTIQYAYAAPGTYLVTAIATDSSSASGSATTSVVVGNRSQLDVAISLAASSTTPTVNTPTVFTISARPGTNASITSIVVNFGDGTSITLPGNATSVTHTYATADTFTVTATATDSSGATGAGSTVIVVGISATFTVSPSTAKIGQPVTASVDSPSSAIAYTWEWGDGSATTSGPSSSHIYLLAGTYTVRLTATDSAGHTTTKTQAVTITI